MLTARQFSGICSLRNGASSLLLFEFESISDGVSETVASVEAACVLLSDLLREIYKHRCRFGVYDKRHDAVQTHAMPRARIYEPIIT